MNSGLHGIFSASRFLVPLVTGLILIRDPLYGQLFQYPSQSLRIVGLGRTPEYLVPHSLRCFENAYAFNHKLYNYVPWEPVSLFIQDLRDYGNAGASTVPRNLISMSIAPLNYVFETSPANERINSTINHELTHIVTMDQAGPSDRFFRSFFLGKVAPLTENPLSVFYSYLTTPRWSSPRWFIEGIAVFMETWNAGGLGRALAGYDEMVFRTRVAEGREIFDMMTVEAEGTAIDFQGGAVSYMHGTRFMTYLAQEYGPEKLVQWTGRSDESRGHFAAQFRNVYGLPLDEAWKQWSDFEHVWQKSNLDSIRLNSLTPYRPLAKKPLGSISRAFFDPVTRNLFAAIRYPGQVASVVALKIDNGTLETLADVKGAALYYASSVAYDPASGNFFFTSDHSAWRDLNVVDVKTSKSRTLIEDARVGDLVYSPTDSSLWGVRHDNGFSTIVRIPFPYTEWNQVYTLPFGKDMYDLDISHDGSRLVAGLTEISGRQKLVLMDAKKLHGGDKSYSVLFDLEFNTPSNFAFTQDDKFLIGSLYYTGVSNIYRYSFESEDMDILSNCETGFFRPIEYYGDSLIVFRYSTDGFIPAVVAPKVQGRVNNIRFLGQAVVEKYPVVTTWKIDPPSSTSAEAESLRASGKEYLPFFNIGLASAYPVVEGFKNFAAFGMRLNFSDPIVIHGMDMTLSYTPNTLLPGDERLHIVYSHKFWEWTIRASYNGSQFYDLFGPTKTTRKGYSLSLQYKTYLIYDEPKTFDFTAAGTGYGGLERLPDFQNVETSFDRFLTLRLALTYKFFNRSIGAVDDEKGIRWQLFSRTTYVQSSLFPHLQASFDYGIALPLDHSSLWLRSSVGYSPGARTEPFANFYFGGFGNNWIDYQDPKRYREDHSFPGVELDAVGGTNYVKMLFEWSLPPLRFRKFGTPDLYCNWARLAFFSSALKTNLYDHVYERVVYDVGAQLDFRIAFLSAFESTLSFGYALATEENRPSSNEFMISLKLLR